jgi:hypothetical protein
VTPKFLTENQKTREKPQASNVKSACGAAIIVKEINRISEFLEDSAISKNQRRKLEVLL